MDAEAFCLEQGLSRYDAGLVAWLVRNHLELSIWLGGPSLCRGLLTRRTGQATRSAGWHASRPR